MKHPLPPRLAEQRIAIALAGCGGNGSQMLSGLARMHFALVGLGHPGLHVVAYDPDTVAEPNIGRQLFSPSDLDKPKSTVLINRINCYLGLDWEAVHGSLREGNYMRRFDLLIGCVDSIKARVELAKNVHAFTYWLDMGNTDKKGQVILGELKPHRGFKQNNPEKGLDMIKQRLPHVLDVFPDLKRKKIVEDDAPSCSLAEALERQDLFINQTVATFALQLLWQFIRQGGLDIHGYFINLETGKVSPLPIK